MLQVTNDYPGTVYWRGIDLYQLDEGNWSTGPHGPTFDDSTGSALSSTPLRDQRPVHGHVKVTGQPQFTVFWPGEPSSASVAYSAVTTESGLLQPAQALVTAYFRGGVPEGAAYDVVAMASAATEDELRQAGNQYPGGSIDARVAELARRVTAGKTNAYDQASAIQSYLRGNFGYQLQVAAPPPGANAVDAFLFDTRIGYCEYFASAFGEMVRSLGIPVRLVNGYGPGLSPELAGRPEFAGAPFNSIRAADAHTWPEVYFPDYGWIAFEPTPDPTYPILTRGPGQSLSAPQRAAAPAHKATSPGRASVFAPALEGVGALSLLAAAVVGVLLLLAVGGTSPDDMEGPWRRLGWLGRRVGVERRQAETPLEYGRRLAVALPRQKQAIGVLVQQYSRQCYGRGSLEPAERETAVAAWRALRAALPRLLLLGPERLRVGLADGQA